MQTPLVSVVLPFYNVVNFLSDTIESVIAQTYPNWELVLVDDGSDDGSTEIAKKFADTYPDKIFYWEHEGHVNKGVTSSRNLSISKTRGDILAFLDADDIWLPGKLKAQVDIMLTYPDTQLLCEAAEYWYYDDPSTPDEIIQVGVERDKLFYPPLLASQLYPLGDAQAPCPSGIMMRKAVIARLGGFEEHFKGPNQFYEDQAFLIKMYLNEPVYISSEYNHRYRQRRGSLMEGHRDKDNYKKARHYFLEWLEEYLFSKQINIPDVNKLLKRGLEPYRRPYASLLKRALRKVGIGS